HTVYDRQQSTPSAENISGSMRLVKTTATASAAIIVLAGAYIWQTSSSHRSQRPTFGPATTNPAVAADVSAPLSTLSPPGDESDRDAADPDRQEEEGRSSTPIRMGVSRASAGVEQMAAGTKPAARLVASFDGEGVGFEGPHGTGRGGNPSDNGLAVGPNHIV